MSDIKTSNFYNQNLEIELKLFEFTLAITMLVFLFWTIVAQILDYSFLIKVIYTSSFIIYTGIYIAYRTGLSFPAITAIYYSSAFIILALGWLPSGGISGAIMHFLILVFISGLLVLPPRWYLLLISFMALLVIGFSSYEFYNPDAASAYSSNLDKIRDLGITSIIMIIVLGLSLYIFKIAYLRDREKLNIAIADLEIEKAKAEMSDQAKTQFLATISHEIRTPLNGVVGISELLESTSLDKGQAELVKNLSYSSRILHSLISDVLDLTMIENERLSLNKNEINLKQELTEMYELFKAKLASKNKEIEILLTIDEKLPDKVIGDLKRVRQVLMNLVNNAIKFTNKGSVTIIATMLTEMDDEIKVRFSVSDTGVGISEEDQSKIFELFFRGKVMNVEGTGLGLAISNKLVELMGGKIEVDSVLTKGSTFNFEIPLTKYKEFETEGSVMEELLDSYRSLNILIADDVRINSLLLQKMLNHLDIHNIDVVGNGKDAVEKAQTTAYDFIFMDIQMPVMDGIEASQIISKANEGQDKPKIIAISADVINKDMDDYAESGFIDFLHKPLSRNVLKEVIKKHLV
ncbi:MAG: ATP-binding protein [Balneolaceae bacterium]